MNTLGTKLATLTIGGALLTGVAITSGPAQPALAGDFTDTTSSSVAAGTSTPSPAARPLPESDAARAALLRSLPTVRLGSKGEAVLALQIGLRAKGAKYLQGTGEFGTLTVRAVEEFQGVYELPVTGVVDARTWSALIARGSGEPYALANPQLRPGQLWRAAAPSGPDFRSPDYLRFGLSRLHELTTWAPATDITSGRYSGAEVVVVKELQRRAGLSPSGILGARTTRVVVLIAATLGGFSS